MSIVYLFLYACVSEDGIGTNTVFMTAISTVASIVTLALGYIAGSNIEE